MIATACAICETLNNADQLYPARFSESDLNEAVFSARRLPDRVHYRMVRCRRCGLLRSDPVAEPEKLAALYRRSTFDYAAELDNLRITYSRYLARVPARGSYLEIGCGNGFMLEEALALGFADAAGVEPSADAVGNSAVRERIVCEMFRPGLFAAASADAIAMFQTLDHLPDPGTVLEECHRVLRPGGFLLLLQHDAGAWSARVLGERSPIIDIEHTYLYDRRTLPALLAKHGFTRRESGRVWNRYSIRYIARLARLRIPLDWPACAPLGNFYVIGERD